MQAPNIRLALLSADAGYADEIGSALDNPEAFRIMARRTHLYLEQVQVSWLHRWRHEKHNMLILQLLRLFSFQYLCL